MDKKKINLLIKELDHKHRIQRKLQFLLDVRGYYIVNKIKGDYVELGLYKGEMLYAAHSIFSKQYDFIRYIGLDTFCGAPSPAAVDKINKYISKNSYSETLVKVNKDLNHITNLELIRGDFRHEQIKKTFNALSPSVSLAVIDCNWITSIEASLSLSFKHMLNGSILYIDDMYISQSEGFVIKQTMYELADKFSLELEPYTYYPPFGRAFFVFRV